MSTRGVSRGLLAAAIVALTFTGGAAANGEEERGIDPNQGDSLVEVVLPDKAAAIRLQLNAESYGVDFNDHYLRATRTARSRRPSSATEDELAALQDAGYELGATIEGPTRGGRASRSVRPTRRLRSRRTRRRSGRTVGITSHDGRDRRPARRLLRELRRPLPLRRGQEPPRARSRVRRTRGRRCRSPSTAARER